MILIYTISFLWILIAIADYSEFCYVWQLKEYRLDRFKDFLSTKQGKDFIKSYMISGRLVIFAFLLLFYSTKFQEIGLVFVVALLAFEIFRYGYKFFRKQFKCPQMTLKAASIIFVVTTFELTLWFLPIDINAVSSIIGVRFFLFSFFVALFYLPTVMIKRIYIFLATNKLKKFPKLIVVGITGSYGKTTVKTFLTQILSSKYEVVSTLKNINTEIGIAKFILKSDFNAKEIFVVEMGAYNLGEIKLICNMVKPSIGILTAINEQHLSLFGSIENIQKAKYELLLSLPSDGLAITNSDNKYCLEFIDKLKCKVKTFGQLESNAPDCLIKNVHSRENGAISFACLQKSEEILMNSNVIGQHNSMNIAACVLAARHIGMEMNAITEQMGHLEMPEGTLRTFAYGESVIIDDSYNANPDGFLAALSILKNYSEWKKVVVTRGMLELGKESPRLHEKIGAQISGIADELMIISDSFEQDLKKGAGGGKLDIFSEYKPIRILEYIKSFKKEKAVILLENRVPIEVMNEIKKNDF